MMTETSKMSAQELMTEMERAASGDNEMLLDTLKEVERLRIICQDIIEMINTDNRMIVENQLDPDGIIKDIEELAHGYYTG